MSMLVPEKQGGGRWAHVASCDQKKVVPTKKVGYDKNKPSKPRIYDHSSKGNTFDASGIYLFLVGVNFSTLPLHGCTVLASCSGHICEVLRRGEPRGVPVCKVLQCQARGISGFVDGSGWEVSARLAWISHIAPVDGHLFLGGCFFFCIFSLTLGFAKTS